MTTLEIILIAILWIVYGGYSGSQWNERESNSGHDEFVVYMVCFIFAPIVFIVRAIAGIIWYK